eukprot:1046277-Pyramimonas_sp.AAC.1
MPAPPRCGSELLVLLYFTASTLLCVISLRGCVRSGRTCDQLRRRAHRCHSPKWPLQNSCRPRTLAPPVSHHAMK